MRSKITLLLFSVLLVVGLGPVGMIVYFFEQVTKSQEEIYRNQSIETLLNDYELDLKKLSKHDPENEEFYKSKFMQVQDHKLVYGEDNYFSGLVRKTLSNSFLIYLFSSVIIALSLGVFISFYINKMYSSVFLSLQIEQERSHYLKEVAQWQDVAKNLAHEVRKPLQPIRLWLSHILNETKSQKNAETIQEAISSIEIEIKNISETMEHFRDFAVLPKPNMALSDINIFLAEFSNSYKDVWGEIDLSICLLKDEVLVEFDANLLKSVFFNLIENAVEANEGSRVQVFINAILKDDFVEVDFFNTGNSIPQGDSEKIFEINYSTKVHKQNMGLGLAIVKTIILEHKGWVKCIEESNGARFLISLPVYSTKN